MSTESLATPCRPHMSASHRGDSDRANVLGRSGPTLQLLTAAVLLNRGPCPPHSHLRAVLLSRSPGRPATLKCARREMHTAKTPLRVSHQIAANVKTSTREVTGLAFRFPGATRPAPSIQVLSWASLRLVGQDTRAGCVGGVLCRGLQDVSS